MSVGVTFAKGFRASGVVAGIKKKVGLHDMTLLMADQPVPAAAVFTRNLVHAAPVVVCKDHLEKSQGKIQAIIVNSGCANAVTGEEGYQNALTMTRETAESVGCKPEEVLVMSTGVIGQQLPMKKVSAGIKLASQSLSSDGGADAALGIMTTDTKPKKAQTVISTSQGEVRIGGMAKGVGMIHPNMATLICIVTTDAVFAPEVLKKIVREVADQSFNRITVDGDTSTNDTFAVLASGASGITPDPEKFSAALLEVCTDLSKQILRDGEGATKLITLRVSGTKTDADATQIAKTIATSLLFKTAIYGKDANWGRVLAAAGRSGVEFDPELAELKFGNLKLVAGGQPLAFSEEAALEILSEPDLDVTLSVGHGKGSSEVWTCDLTHEYVSINAHYRT